MAAQGGPVAGPSTQPLSEPIYESIETDTAIKCYALQIDFDPVRFRLKRELVRRVLSVPATHNFRQLRDVIRICFRWDEHELYNWIFKVKDTEEMRLLKHQGSRDLVKISPEEMDPFDAEYFDPEWDPAWHLANETRIHEVFEDERFKGKVVDFQWRWNWNSIITVIGRREGNGDVVLLDAKGHLGRGKWSEIPQLDPPFSMEDREKIVRKLERMNEEHRRLYPIVRKWIRPPRRPELPLNVRANHLLLRMKYPHDRFDAFMKWIALDHDDCEVIIKEEQDTPPGVRWVHAPRLWCRDCPGILHRYGPGESMKTFQNHLRNEEHRHRIWCRMVPAMRRGDVDEEDLEQLCRYPRYPHAPKRWT